jgi:hypothetical protein
LPSLSVCARSAADASSASSDKSRIYQVGICGSIHRASGIGPPFLLSGAVFSVYCEALSRESRQSRER